MTKWIVASVFALSSSAFAESILLDNTSLQSLQLNESSVRVMVSYPGHEISGVCEIEIVADSFNRNIPVERLLNEIEVRSGFGEGAIAPQVVSEMALRIPLMTGTFTDGITVTTKSGKPLKEVIESVLGKARRVVVLPRSC
jgi:hypothetical protein